MADRISKSERSFVMSRVSAKNTKPELIVRRMLHAAGFRFRIHNPKLAGNPDIVLRRYRTIIFVHGCFWHRHPKCRRATVPASNVGYWSEKFENNVDRDKRVRSQLRRLGWRVIVVWECETTCTDKLLGRLKRALERERPR